MRSIYTEQRETTLVNTHTNEDKTLISFLSFHAHNHSSHLSSASLKENPKLTKNTDLKNPHLPNLFTKLVHQNTLVHTSSPTLPLEFLSPLLSDRRSVKWWSRRFVLAGEKHPTHPLLLG
ncbi:hypothetical protein HanRHA438_Chr15g0718281 [Helianthus annuus]|nr:hypothetical protein HanXRQr2_Chr15g0706031 [Helianthus annuus]KAJ0452125.1 hypothetical protein HanHA300_Chr15g0575411 [Helianthus annuus]KAJ0452126.1 hypothetical protein HanHA300_Chr15g0575421 [Helianthus annuus]KAJ0456917.1 hypothetical protein HanIR_Chr15g0767931 [Helianthus annuus]KAJ0474031.1 hypothetical protein HanHA89_Chr15g0625131 [Helianthus annuus]